MSFESVKALVADDLQEVDRVIRNRLASDVVLVNQVAEYIVGSGGKRLRPLVVVVAARACGSADQRHTEAAAIIEFIHTATLLHDDVVDGSKLRRGRDTANAVWGNEASVLVGDYVYSRAFEMMVSLGSMRIMDVMASATNKIAEGEVLQLMNAHDPDTHRGTLFRGHLSQDRASCSRPARRSPRSSPAARQRSKTPWRAMASISARRSSSSTMCSTTAPTASNSGKNLGDDLAEGKPTLPLIYALQTRHRSSSARSIRSSIEHGSIDEPAADHRRN